VPGAVAAASLGMVAGIVLGVAGLLITKWQAAAGAGSFIDGFGVAGSLGAGAAVIGYYLVYGIGLRYRIRVWQRRSLRVMGR